MNFLLERNCVAFAVIFVENLFMGLLHCPTRRARPGKPTWSDVGRMHDLPQMTHFDVGESGRQPAVFVYFPFLIDEIGQLDNIQFEESNFVN